MIAFILTSEGDSFSPSTSAARLPSPDGERGTEVDGGGGWREREGRAHC